MIRTLFSVLLLVLCPVGAQSQRLRVEAGGRTATVDAARTEHGIGYPIAALEAMGARVMPVTGGVRAVLFDDTVTFRIGSPFFETRSTVFPLATVVSGSADGIIIPAQFFEEWLPVAFAGRVGYADGVLVVVGPVDWPDPPAATGPRIVVLDPGHGGEDTGKIASNGLREKDAALDLCRRIATLLEERGYEVHLTRATDTLVALADRPHLANQWKAGRPAAVFLSIHLNSVAGSAARTARGFETFFLSQARTDDERRVAEMENAAVEFENGPSPLLSEEALILSGLRNDFYVRASNDLADAVQRGIATVHAGPDRGVKRAGFMVLVGALMPAVLVEVGFISHAAESRLIGQPDFRAGIARALTDAVDRFFDEHEHLWAGG